VITSERLAAYSGGLGPARGREAPCTPGLKLPPSSDAHKGGFRLPDGSFRFFSLCALPFFRK
jgi:hypothetical protein